MVYNTNKKSRFMRQFLQKELVEIHGRVEKRRIEKTDIAESFMIRMKK